MKFSITHIKDGRRIDIVREAISEERLELSDLGVVVSIKRAKDGAFSFARQIDFASLSVVFLQLSLLVRAGVELGVALADVASSSSDKRIKRIFNEAREDLLAGLGLYAGFEKFKPQIGAISLAFIGMGESSGRLSESLKSLSDVLKARHDAKKRLKKASTYPMIVFISIILAFFTLCAFVVPQFSQIFADMGADLPIATRLLLGIYGFVRDYGAFVLLLLIISVFAMFKMYAISDKFKLACDKKFLGLFLLGKTTIYSSLSLFCLIFSELVRAGMPLPNALKQAASSVQNSYLSQRLSAIEDMLLSGTDLKSCFENSKMFDKTSIWLISTALQTGELSRALFDMHKYYDEKFNDISERIQTYIEPVLLVFVGVMVLFLALGVLMPVWDMTSIVRF